MKNTRKIKKRTRKTKKGGLFGMFNKKPIVSSSECDINNLSLLSKDTGDGQDPINKMHSNYLKCCPKTILGQYNSSPYCKQLKMNFDSQVKYQRDIAGYYGDETDVAKIRQVMNEPIGQKKSWFQFKKGGKTRKYKKLSRRHKK
jgi:hypothetical protein